LPALCAAFYFRTPLQKTLATGLALATIQELCLSFSTSTSEGAVTIQEWQLYKGGVE